MRMNKAELKLTKDELLLPSNFLGGLISRTAKDIDDFFDNKLILNGMEIRILQDYIANELVKIDNDDLTLNLLYIKSIITADSYNSNEKKDKSHATVNLIEQRIAECWNQKVKDDMRINANEYNGIFKYNSLEVKGSTGIGLRSYIPWVALLDQNLSLTNKGNITTTKGLYPCIMLDITHRKVYGVVMIGVDNIDKKDIPMYVNYLKTKFGNIMRSYGFNTTDDINLNCSKERAVKYKLGTLCSKEIFICDETFENKINEYFISSSRLFNKILPDIVSDSYIMSSLC